MTVSTVLVSTDQLLRWSHPWVGSLLRQAPVPHSDRQKTLIEQAYLQAFGVKEGAVIESRPGTARADTAPLSLAMLKDWAKNQHKALRAAQLPFSLTAVQEAWATALGASGWKGVPGRLHTLNAEREQRRNRWGAIPDRAPVVEGDFILVNRTTLAQVSSVTWAPTIGRWFLSWDLVNLDGRLSERYQAPDYDKKEGQGPYTEIERVAERVAEPDFPLDLSKGPLHQVLDFLAPLNDIEGRKADLTASAIDWAMSIAEEMFEFTHGDAGAVADMAINATLDSLGNEDDDEGCFDDEQLEAAIQAAFDGIEAEQDDDEQRTESDDNNDPQPDARTPDDFFTLLTAAEFGAHLSQDDKSVMAREEKGELFAVMRPGQKRDREYPKYQLMREWRWKNVVIIREALGIGTSDVLHSFLSSPNERLGQLTPVEVLTGKVLWTRPQIKGALALLPKDEKQRIDLVLDAARSYLP
jgi:hypothetical protein